jgi:chemotaxis protein MotB
MPGVKINSSVGEQTRVKSLIWLTTFNDLMTLLMVFFVLLFSVGTMDVKRFKNFQNALQSAMGVFYEGRHSDEGLISDKQWYVVDSPPLGKQGEDYRSLAQTQGLEAQYTPKGLQLTLNDELLFGAGSAQLTAEGLKMLQKVSAIIKPLNRAVRVEGHTDDRPITTARYPSNWELSTARAIRVIDYFIDQGGIAAQSLSAVGYGSVKPKFPNDSEQHRAMNRRVEIILGPMNPSTTGTGPIEGE